MTAVERLAEIEARAAAARPTLIRPLTYPDLYALDQIVIHDVPALVATLRAVLDLLDGGDLLAALAGKDEGRIPTSALRLVIDAALDVTA